METKLTRSEVRANASRNCCWVIISGQVYDVTDFLDEHPGGAAVVLRYAGRDATEAFVPLHAAGTLEKHLPPRMGAILEQETGTGVEKQQPNSQRATESVSGPKRPKLSSLISLDDFDVAASKVLAPRSFAFLATGAEDGTALRRNRTGWSRLRFRPRVLRPITQVDTSCTLFGALFAAPYFVCPAGGGKLAHTDGEVLLTRAAGRRGVLQWVCNNAGCTITEMAAAAQPGQTLFWQVYVKADLAASEAEIREAIALGYKGFAITVDAIRPGKREQDIRASLAEEDQDEDIEEDEDANATFAQAPTVKRPPVYSEFDWPAAVQWLQRLTDLPIAVKGIQSWEDAALCKHYGVHPWLSNHGGRQLDTAPTAVDTLLEMRRNCPDVFSACEVVVDGGVRRGADVVKALALGARAVGLGRPFLYALTLGTPGVLKALDILQHEVETTMALLGVVSIGELRPSHVAIVDQAYL